MHYVYKDDTHTSLLLEGDDALSFNASMVHFSKKIEIKKCTIVDFDVFGMYCLGGLHIHDCIIRCEVSWQSGGHNHEPIVIENCVFEKFVDFEDCTFDSRVILRNVHFKGGTNLFGNQSTPVVVIFAVPPLLDNVSGDINLDTFRVNMK